ncbi:hypothetical protein [Thermogemmatispora sp.]|uniref:hypothetical protein n=1 Tax=Thermogemmatispora sp. TaxID=1968838 RepID=UPI00257A91E5|nr:hypothetical protein [Thermogemmatispora sp.]
MQAALLEQERIFLSLPLYQGQRWLRAVLLHPATNEALIERLRTGLERLITQERRRDRSRLVNLTPTPTRIDALPPGPAILKQERKTPEGRNLPTRRSHRTS